LVFKADSDRNSGEQNTDVPKGAPLARQMLSDNFLGLFEKKAADGLVEDVKPQFQSRLGNIRAFARFQTRRVPIQ
jgi:hypothetical protein